MDKNKPYNNLIILGLIGDRRYADNDLIIFMKAILVDKLNISWDDSLMDKESLISSQAFKFQAVKRPTSNRKPAP